MASTRNINYPGNYCLEQKQHTDSAGYTLYPYSQYGSAYKTSMPGNGICPGQIPGSNLSNNSVEIESFLFGINSTNLVTLKKPSIVPDFKCLGQVNLYEKHTTIIPRPLYIEKNQRPNIL
jgi:hypothetical protein